MDSSHYTYRVYWSEEDKEHVAKCAEFPSLSYLEKTPTNAIKGIVRTVESVIEDMKENNEHIPEPLGSKAFSGKFMVRVPPEQHRDLAIKAAEQGVSLNRYIASQLIT